MKRATAPFSAGLLLPMCAFAATLLPTLAQSNDKVALVIGIDAYQHVPRLNQAVNDAKQIGQTLEGIGFKVDSLLDPTQQDMLRAIDDFSVNNASAALAVVYFAGHGVEVDGEHYLIPVDSNPQRESAFEYEAVSLGRLLNTMADHQNCLRVLILDACRDNPFAQGANRSLGMTRGLGTRTKPSPKQTLTAYSAGSGQQALDGMYTPALLKYLKDPSLRGEEVFYNIANEVSDKTSGSQEPAMYIVGGRPFSFHTIDHANNNSGGNSNSGSNSGNSGNTSPPPPPEPQIDVTNEEVQEFIDSWVRGWESKNINQYSAHYAPSFAGSVYSTVSGQKSLTRRAWMADKAGKFSGSSYIDINYRDASYKRDGETVLLTFTQDFKSDGYSDTGGKVLVLRKFGRELKIVNEKFFPPDVRHDYDTSDSSSPYAVVNNFVRDWADAWESRDISRYKSHYSSSFRGKRGSNWYDYNGWMNYMSGKFRETSWISVGINNIDIRQDGNNFNVRYRQVYKASNFSDVGYKMLTLTPENGTLKITSESWRGL